MKDIDYVVVTVCVEGVEHFYMCTNVRELSIKAGIRETTFDAELLVEGPPEWRSYEPNGSLKIVLEGDFDKPKGEKQ